MQMDPRAVPYKAAAACLGWHNTLAVTLFRPAALPTWSNTSPWTGWPRATAAARKHRRPNRPADRTSPAWSSRGRRLLEGVTCSSSRRHPCPCSTRISRRAAHLNTPPAAPHRVRNQTPNLNAWICVGAQICRFLKLYTLTIFFSLFSVSEISGYSSGYDSEATSSECLSIDEMEKESQQRRVRTKFTTEQINKLEKIFSKHKYLDAGERMKTAQKLSLTETQVGRHLQWKLAYKSAPCSPCSPLSPLCRSEPGFRTGG